MDSHPEVVLVEVVSPREEVEVDSHPEVVVDVEVVLEDVVEEVEITPDSKACTIFNKLTTHCK